MRTDLLILILLALASAPLAEMVIEEEIVSVEELAAIDAALAIGAGRHAYTHTPHSTPNLRCCDLRGGGDVHDIEDLASPLELHRSRGRRSVFVTGRTDPQRFVFASPTTSDSIVVLKLTRAALAYRALFARMVRVSARFHAPKRRRNCGADSANGCGQRAVPPESAGSCLSLSPGY